MLREAIVNALVHADYAQRGAPMRVAFFDDRIDIESPGLVVPGMTVQDMKSGTSRIRDPVMTRVFRELGPIKQRGSVFAEATALGLPEPQLEEIATGMHLRIWLGDAQAVQESKPAAPADKERQQSTSQQELQPQSQLGACRTWGGESEKWPQRAQFLPDLQPNSGAIGQKAGKKWAAAAILQPPTPTSDRLLVSNLTAQVFMLLTTHEAGKAVLAPQLGHRSVSDELHKQVRRMLDMNLIEMTLPDKPNSRLQRYRLTPEGRALLVQAATPAKC